MKDFLSAIDTAGGHMMVCLLLILLGVAVHLWVPDPLVHDLVIGSEGVMFGAMKGRNGAKEVNPQPPAPPIP